MALQPKQRGKNRRNPIKKQLAGPPEHVVIILHIVVGQQLIHLQNMVKSFDIIIRYQQSYQQSYHHINGIMHLCGRHHCEAVWLGTWAMLGTRESYGFCASRHGYLWGQCM